MRLISSPKNSDRLEMLRSELELTRAKQTQFNTRISVIRAVQDLENTIQYPLFDDLNLESALSNLFDGQISDLPEPE